VSFPSALVVLGAVIACAAACGGDVVVYSGEAWRTDPPGPGDLRGRILTTNSGDDTLSVIDPVQVGERPGRISVGFNPVEPEGPHHLAVDPVGRYVYVNLSLYVSGSGSGPHGVHGSGDEPGYLFKLDARNGRPLGRVRVDANPGDNVISTDGSTVIVSHFDLRRWHSHKEGADLRSTIVLVDTASMTLRARIPVCPAAHGVRFSLDGRFAYVACASDQLAIVDLVRDDHPVRLVPIPGGKPEALDCARCPYTIGVAPDGTVWVSNLGPNLGLSGRGGLDVFDPRLGPEGAFDPRRSLLFEGRAMFTTFATFTTPPVSAPAGSAGEVGRYRAYVPEQRALASLIRVFEANATAEPPRELEPVALPREQCQDAHVLLVDAATARGHLVCEGDHKGAGTFLWLDLEGRSVLGWAAIGVFPDGLALVPFPPQGAP
jgi:DNA-binding beta-propeller fold protein YncE